MYKKILRWFEFSSAQSISAWVIIKLVKAVSHLVYSDYRNGYRGHTILLLHTYDLGNLVYSACKHQVMSASDAVREPLSSAQLLSAYLPASAATVVRGSYSSLSDWGLVCFDSQACLPLRVPGANWSQITLK